MLPTLALAACAPSRPTPAVSTTPRWEAVVALAETACEPWPEDVFSTDLGPADRRAALRTWLAAHPDAVVDVDARYVTFAYVDHLDPEDLPAVARLVASLRACGRWVDQRMEEELVLRACAVDPAATSRALGRVPPPPSLQVRAAREAVWVVDQEAPDVDGRFTATLILGAKSWMATWVLDGEGVLPEIPVNLPFGQILREETRPPDPDVTAAVARCTTDAPEGPFAVLAPGAAGVVRQRADGVPVGWWPDDAVLGGDGALGPIAWWTGGERRGVLSVGPTTRVEHCPGRFHREAALPLGDAVVPGPAAELGIALSPAATENPWRLESDACGPVLTGPAGGSWSLGCCR